MRFLFIILVIIVLHKYRNKNEYMTEQTYMNKNQKDKNKLLYKEIMKLNKNMDTIKPQVEENTKKFKDFEEENIE